MTDHNREEREALIAKAKQAISDYDIAKAHRVSVAPDRLAILLAEFVAVFEQAHTPTGDEREALRFVEIALLTIGREGGDIRVKRGLEVARAALQSRRTVQGEPTDADWIDDIETMALAQAAGYARMLEIGEGVGGLGVRNPAMFEDMLAWDEATKNGHADTVLRLVAALRAAAVREEGQGHGE